MPWSARIHTEFHVYRVTQDTTRSALSFRLRGYHPLWPDFPDGSANSTHFHIVVPQPRQDKSRRFGLFRFRSPLLTESILFLFLRLLRCFTSPRVASPDYEFIRSIPDINPAGLPHSEIHGSTPACGSPWLIATCYVLHRLLTPRHPPFALVA